MRLFSLVVLFKGDPSAHILKAGYDLSSISFFQRGTAQEFISFTAKILTERTSIGARQSVKEAEYYCHVFVRGDSLAGVCISDHEYPPRVAHTMIIRVLEDFAGQVSPQEWTVGTEVATKFNGQLETYLGRFQDPAKSDATSRLQADLDDTKIILHNTIEAVLQRGEKLDDLVDKSEALTLQSKAFYKTARKTNSCCGTSWG
jgi:synaptobrevin family protein YKT6